MSGRNLALRGWFAMLLASSSAATIEVPTGTEDFTLSIEPLIQPRIQVDWDGPPGSAAPSGRANTDFFIRRARLLLRGTAYQHFSYGINIVALRIGERGNLNVTPFLQDAVVGFVPALDVHFEMGLLLMPLSHAAVEAPSMDPRSRASETSSFTTTRASRARSESSCARSCLASGCSCAVDSTKGREMRTRQERWL